jgi:hypothetical protein
MTSTAAATRTLRSPRRRTRGPAAGERVGALSGVIGATVLVAAACILSSTPSVDATPVAVRHHLDGHYTVTMASAYATMIGALLLVPFLASLRTFTSRRSDVGQWRWTVTLLTGAIGIAMLSLAGALLATATLLANRSTADEAVFAVFVAAKLVATLALLPVAALVLANARTIATSQRRPDRWLIRFDIQIAVIAVIASIVLFVDQEWLTPGEPVAAAAWLLVALWVVALARTIARGDRTTLSEEQNESR